MKTNTNLLGKRSLLSLITIVAVTAGYAHTSRAELNNGDKIIIGETAEIAGGTAATWARVNGGGKVIWLGLTIPLSMVENMPAPGAGPARAVAVLNFPQVVRETTYFNHAEIQSNQHGHGANPAYVDPHRYEAPHFDFHFYNIPVADVWPIPPGVFPAEVAADRLPPGYGQPAESSVPQMGRHATLLTEFTATEPWLLTMIAGFLPDASYMHFIEPMITQEFLLRRENFSLPVPIPATLGQATNYPSECEVHYDKDADAYHIVFKGFEPIE